MHVAVIMQPMTTRCDEEMVDFEANSWDENTIFDDFGPCLNLAPVFC